MEIDMVCTGREYLKNLAKFTYNRSMYFKSLGYQVDDGTRRQMIDDYKFLVQDVVRYLNTLFPEGFSEKETTYDISYEDMLNSVMDDTASFLRVPSFDATFKPLGDETEAILSFKNGTIARALHMETIKGLPHKYKTTYFNDLVIGLNLYDIRNLLDQLKVLPESNILDTFIKEQEMRAGERIDFLNAVILRLILNGTKEDLIRAHIFDYYMRVGFDFDQLSIEDQEKRTK